MKFSEKLTNLRKQNNKSQEQLADKLGVSRQAVSKWESGQSIPDMEKMMQLCKILNCSLDELVDDGVTGNSKQVTSEKIDWHTYYNEVIEFITKTLNMFWSMRLIEKVKCILEMLCLGLILFFIWAILGNIIQSCFNQILVLLPDTIYRLIYSISSFVYQIFGIIVGFVLLVHIFKIRYLDYFITVEDNNTKEKNIEIPIEEIENKKEISQERQFVEKKKNKIIIRDPKHSTYNFFSALAKLVIWFIKFLLILFAIPCIISFITITFLGVCSILYLKSGIFFLGVLIFVLGILLINYLLLKMIYYFIFGLKQTYKKIFILIITGLILIGIGGSISFCTYLNFDKITIDIEDKIITSHELEYNDKMIIEFLNYEYVSIVEDNNLTNIKIDIEHTNKVESYIQSNQHYTTIINDYGESKSDIYNIYNYGFSSYRLDDIDEINYLLDMLKNKKRFNLDGEIMQYKITITTSKAILEKLEENYQNFYNS